ncbi:MAG TPA: 16S rRNA (cytidine(1402)-2'-O)-methyltransferase [Myxococcota bacterium]|nr:16S rRNA (cytidine(1402)-2'-O)-methyltransferase [Myxococcota bacterium]
MATRLKILATPIGNIRDISLRAMDEIKRADVIFAEDTRHSLKLIQALNIELKPDCRLVSCDAHKERDRIDVVIARLLANDQVLLISDAGCPTISDPGSLLVQGVLQKGLAVEVIPGPSAHSTALMGAGIDTTRFAFLGFLPQKKTARKKLIESAASAGLALVIYESPLRVLELLDELFLLLGARRVVVARELTKLHETFHRGVLGSPLDPPVVEKGECVVVIEAGDKTKEKSEQAQDIGEFIETQLAQGESAKDVAKLVAAMFNMKKKTAYDLVITSRR